MNTEMTYEMEQSKGNLCRAPWRKSVSAWLEQRICITEKNMKRNMKLLKVRQVYRGPWMRYKEGRNPFLP